MTRPAAPPPPDDASSASARLEALLQANHWGIFELSTCGQLRYHNPRFAALLGLGPDPAAGFDLAWALDETGRQNWEDNWNQARAGNASFCFEARTAADPRRSLRFLLTPLTTDAFLGMVFDVSERTQALATLHESEQRFAKIFQLLPELVSISEIDSARVIEVNHHLETMLGFRREELLGRTAIELGIWHDTRERAQLLEQIGRDGMVRDLYVHLRRKDGTLIDCEMSGSIIELHGAPHLLLIMRDVTEARRTAAALRQSEARLRAIFEQGITFSGLLTLDGTLIQANQAALAFCNVSDEQVLNRPFWDTPWWTNMPEEQAQLRQAISAAAQGQSLRFETRHYDQTGIPHQIDFSIKPAFDSAGNICLLVVEGRDITDLHQAKQQLAQLNQALEQRVEERTAALEQANRELSQVLATLQQAQSGLVRSEKMAALGGLVAGITHELNTPLGNCVMLAGSMKEQVDNFCRQVKEANIKRSDFVYFLEFAQHSSELLLRNLQQASELMSSFKQVAVDRASNQRRRFDLARVIEETLHTLKPTLSRFPGKIEIKTQLQPAIELDSYPGALNQALTNLLTNALTHAFAGRNEGTLTIRTRAEPNEAAILEFQDNGVGMSSDVREHIFEPFFTTRRNEGGSGLGLSIVRNIATHILGGGIHVDSVPGMGTLFRLQLPRVAPLLEQEEDA